MLKTVNLFLVAGTISMIVNSTNPVHGTPAIKGTTSISSSLRTLEERERCPNEMCAHSYFFCVWSLF